MNQKRGEVSSLLIDRFDSELKEFKGFIDVPPINLASEAIVEINLTKLWNISIITIKTPNGDEFEILYDKDSNLVEKNTEETKRLQEAQRKRFRMGYLDNNPCLIYKKAT